MTIYKNLYDFDCGYRHDGQISLVKIFLLD